MHIMENKHDVYLIGVKHRYFNLDFAFNLEDLGRSGPDPSGLARLVSGTIGTVNLMNSECDTSRAY